MAAVSPSERVWRAQLRCLEHPERYLSNGAELRPCGHRVCEICLRTLQRTPEGGCPLCRKIVKKVRPDHFIRELTQRILTAVGEYPIANEEPPYIKAQVALSFGSWEMSYYGKLYGNMLRLVFASTTDSSLFQSIYLFRYEKEDHLRMQVEFNKHYPRIAYDYLARRGLKEINEETVVKYGRLFLTTKPETRAAFSQLFNILIEDNEFPQDQIPRLRKLVDEWTQYDPDSSRAEPTPSLRQRLFGDDYQRVNDTE